VGAYFRIITVVLCFLNVFFWMYVRRAAFWRNKRNNKHDGRLALLSPLCVRLLSVLWSRWGADRRGEGGGDTLAAANFGSKAKSTWPMRRGH